MQASRGAGLPPPDDESNEHSRRCALHIRARMQAAGGSLSFADFMQEALYAPGLGYYAAGATKFGRQGDFVTAPEVSPLFGRVLARVCAEVLEALGDGGILEFGGGSGRLAVDVLRKLESLGSLPTCYSILEVSAELRERQSAVLARELPHLAGRVRWLDELPAAHRGLVLANEVLDALPVERFRINDGVRQLRVGLDGDRFRWFEAPAPARLESAVVDIESDIGRQLEAGFTSEYSPLAAPWIASVCDRLDAGLVLLFDYGTSRREYYAPDRFHGWLRCHFRHHVHDDPLLLPGIQDISGWVDFTAAADAAAGAGAGIAGFVSQAGFLLAGGILEEAAACSPASPRARIELATQVKMLTLPGQMGERFKCLGLARALDADSPRFDCPGQDPQLMTQRIAARSLA